MVLVTGTAAVKGGGVAGALNFKRQDEKLVTDSKAGKVSCGKGSVEVASTSEQPIGTPRRLVVGLIGGHHPYGNGGAKARKPRDL